MLRQVFLGTTTAAALLMGGMSTAEAGHPHHGGGYHGGHNHGGGHHGGGYHGGGYYGGHSPHRYYGRPVQPYPVYGAYPIYRPAPVVVPTYPPACYGGYYGPSYAAPRSGFGIRTDDFSLWLGR